MKIKLTKKSLKSISDGCASIEECEYCPISQLCNSMMRRLMVNSPRNWSRGDIKILKKGFEI